MPSDPPATTDALPNARMGTSSWAGSFRYIIYIDTHYYISCQKISTRHDNGDATTPDMRDTTKGTGVFLNIKSFWLCCRNFPIVSGIYDADGQHKFGAASPKRCDEDAMTHEAVTMVRVLLCTHSTTLLHHYQHMWRQKSNLPSFPPPQCVGLMMQARSRPLTLQHYPSSTGTNDVNADGGYVWTAMKVVNDAAERKSMEGLFSFRSSSGVLFLYNYYCWNIIYNVLLKDV